MVQSSNQDQGAVVMAQTQKNGIVRYLLAPPDSPMLPIRPFSTSPGFINGIAYHGQGYPENPRSSPALLPWFQRMPVHAGKHYQDLYYVNILENVFSNVQWLVPYAMKMQHESKVTESETLACQAVIEILVFAADESDKPMASSTKPWNHLDLATAPSWFYVAHLGPGCVFLKLPLCIGGPTMKRHQAFHPIEMKCFSPKKPWCPNVNTNIPLCNSP